PTAAPASLPMKPSACSAASRVGAAASCSSLHRVGKALRASPPSCWNVRRASLRSSTSWERSCSTQESSVLSAKVISSADKHRSKRAYIRDLHCRHGGGTVSSIPRGPTHRTIDGMSLDLYRTLKLSLSAEEFRRLPRNAAYKYELIAGEVWLTP